VSCLFKLCALLNKTLVAHPEHE